MFQSGVGKEVEVIVVQQLLTCTQAVPEAHTDSRFTVHLKVRQHVVSSKEVSSFDPLLQVWVLLFAVVPAHAYAGCSWQEYLWAAESVDSAHQLNVADGARSPPGWTLMAVVLFSMS